MLTTEHFKDSAVKVGTEFSDAKLRPLQMFRGRMGMSAIRSHIGVFLSMLKAETRTRAEICKHSIAHPDDVHFVGRHSPVNGTSLAMFICRLYAAPEMMPALDPHLKEYLDEFSHENRIHHFELTKISAEAFRTRWDWRLVKRPPKERGSAPPVAEYPFIRQTPTDEHALLMTIHDAVPKGIAAEIRGDLCQDLIVAVLSGEMKLANVGEEWRNYLKSCRKKYQERWGTISLDYPTYGNERPLKDLIADHEQP
jgi:hypothetical protein